MKEFNEFAQEQFKKNKKVYREFQKLDPFFNLGVQILLLRKAKGISQKELAKLANTTQAVISRIENASTKTTLETAIRVADALNSKVEISISPITEETEKTFTEERKANTLPVFYMYYIYQKKDKCIENKSTGYRVSKETRVLEFA